MVQLLTDYQVGIYAHAAGFTGPDLPIAIAVCNAESSRNPYAVNVNANHSVDHGLWQINDINHDALAIGDWRDPATNARMARIVWLRQGWKGWATFNNGDYLPFLGNAKDAADTILGSAPFKLYRTLSVSTPYEQGSDVVSVQRLAGVVPVDGIYGPVTAGYVGKWQSAHGLVQDGVFGPLSAKAAGWDFVTS